MAAAEHPTALSYAVRGPVVAKYLSQIGVVLALMTLAPLVAAVAAGDAGFAWRCGHVVAGLLLVCLPFARLRVAAHVQVNEALVITALAFVFASLVMIWPFMAVGLGFVDAWFEAVSGVTTTGLTTLSEVSSRSAAFLFARSWMQWYGGLGIAIMWVALLLSHNFALRRLVEGAGVENLATTAQLHARRVLIIYSLLTVAGILLLLLLHERPLSAITHALSAISTGGFSLHDDSLAGLGAARYAVSLIAFCGAISLPLYYLLYQRHWAGFFRDAELRALLSVLAIICLLLWLLLLRGGMAADAALGHALVMGVSAQTTSGYSSLSVAELGAAAKWILIAAMLTGGCVGSTAGGIKMLRLLVFGRLLQLILRRAAMPPHAVIEPRLGGRRLEDDDIQRALLVIVLFGAGVALSWLPFLLAGYAPLDALLEVVSATGTVGLSSGITRMELETPLKLVLMADMLFGRVEFIALLVVLWPGTWFGRRDSAL